MSNRFSTMDNRLVFKNGLDLIKEAGLTAQGVKLTQSTLRLEQQISPTKTNYVFGILTNNNGPSNTLFPTEIRLNQQDSFITSAIALRIAEPTSATDTTFKEYTWPNPAAFTAAGPPTEAASLETLYKGFLRITVNNVVVMPTLHLGRFRFAQETQQGTAPPPAADSFDGSSDGVSITEPNIVLIGSKNSVIELVLPASVATIGAAGFSRMIIEFRGLLAQNSTIVT